MPAGRMAKAALFDAPCGRIQGLRMASPRRLRSPQRARSDAENLPGPSHRRPWHLRGHFALFALRVLRRFRGFVVQSARQRARYVLWRPVSRGYVMSNPPHSDRRRQDGAGAGAGGSGGWRFSILTWIDGAKTPSLWPSLLWHPSFSILTWIDGAKTPSLWPSLLWHPSFSILTRIDGAKTPVMAMRRRLSSFSFSILTRIDGPKTHRVDSWVLANTCFSILTRIDGPKTRAANCGRSSRRVSVSSLGSTAPRPAQPTAAGHRGEFQYPHVDRRPQDPRSQLRQVIEESFSILTRIDGAKTY